MRRTNTFIVLLGLFFGGLFLPLKHIDAAGASMYMSPSTGTYVIGGKFSVAIIINSGGQAINAAEGSISFDTDLLKVVSVAKGSVFKYWTTEPSFSNSASTVNFGGGVPPPAFNGTAGRVITISFQAKKAGKAQVRFTAGAVLANDGKGTNVLTSMGSASYTLVPKTEAPVSNNKKTEKKVYEPERIKPQITSPTHPDQNKWYREDKVLIKWSTPAGVKGVSISFNQEPTADPGPVSDGYFSEKEFQVAKSGVWYAHIKLKDAKGWGTTAHFRVMVDINPPEPFTVEVKYIKVGDWPELHFNTKDKESGLLKYEIIVGSLDSQTVELKPEEKMFKPSGLSGGEHTALIKAIDKAGNERISSVNFKVEPIPTPTIDNYPSEVKPSDSFYMSGTAVSESVVNVYIEENNKNIAIGKVKSDANGKWFFIYDKKLPEGRYTAWVDAINKNGIKSEPASKISFLVTPPVFAVIGSFVVNYFTVFVSIIFLAVLIILLIVYIIAFIRRKLKRETVEVEEVLKKNMKLLQKEVENDIDRLAAVGTKAALNREKNKTKTVLKDKIEIMEKKILKEIKDVEDILK